LFSGTLGFWLQADFSLKPKEPSGKPMGFFDEDKR